MQAEMPMPSEGYRGGVKCICFTLSGARTSVAVMMRKASGMLCHVSKNLFLHHTTKATARADTFELIIGPFVSTSRPSSLGHVCVLLVEQPFGHALVGRHPTHQPTHTHMRRQHGAWPHAKTRQLRHESSGLLGRGARAPDSIVMSPLIASSSL